MTTTRRFFFVGPLFMTQGGIDAELRHHRQRAGKRANQSNRHQTFNFIFDAFAYWKRYGGCLTRVVVIETDGIERTECYHIAGTEPEYVHPCIRVRRSVLPQVSFSFKNQNPRPHNFERDYASRVRYQIV